MPTKINVDGKSLKVTDETLVNDWNCYESQFRARQAFNREGPYTELPESYYLLNYAPTGGGKTMSWEDPVIRNGLDAIVIYPTNALIQDQVQNIENHINDSDMYDAADDVATLTITADELAKERDRRPGAVGNNGELFRILVREKRREYDSVIVFTNPDIFSNLRNNVYQNSMGKRATEGFDVVVVDEFHWADESGRVTILNQLEQIRADENTETNRCMLLSATPDEKVLERLEATPAKVVDLTEKTSPKPHSEVADSNDYRTVLPPINLEVRRGQTFQVGDSLVSDKWRDDTFRFCQQADKTVIMLDSQKEVSKVKSILDRHLSREVMQIDGQNKMDLREKIGRFNDSDEPMVLVSNSAVEVGIDFDTDQIIFSGTSSKRMLQRFGRLRNRTDRLDAIAYVPNEFVERLCELDKDSITRDELRDIIDQVYRESRRPHSYPSTYGAHEAYEQVERHANQVSPERRETVLERGLERIEKQQLEPFGIDVDWDAFKQEHQEMKNLVGTLMQYRTGEPSTLVYDTRDDTIRTHQIGGILRTGNIEIVERDEFISRVRDKSNQRNPISEIKRNEQYTFGYIIYHRNEYARMGGKNVSDRKVMVAGTHELRGMLSENIAERKPKLMDTYQLRVDPRDLSPINLEPLNDALYDASPLVYPVEMTAYEAQAQLGLDNFFFLSDVALAGDKKASVAFGQNALYLHCIMQENLYRKNPDREDLEIRVPVTVWDT